jgi:hypothetical protein
MLITGDNRTGIDEKIKRVQIAMYSRLKTVWGITNDNDYDCYGRVYRNKKDNQYIAELYTGNGEYKDVYWDDKKAAISWFGTGSIITYDIQNIVPVHLVFFVNLKKLKPTIQHRADEEVRRDVQKVFGKFFHGFTFGSIELWLENVLKEYPGSRRDKLLSAVDMEPVHCFRLNLTLIYPFNNNCVL